jgi:transketolase
VAASRDELGWAAPAFEIPAEIADAWNAEQRGASFEADWRAR